jgi:hypothetical protein
VRILAALAFAIAINAVVQASWIGLLVTIYGSLDTALRDLRPSLISAGGSAAYFASGLAGFLGAFIAPLVLGSYTQSRRAVVLSSVVGAVLGVVPAILLAALAGSLSWVVAPATMMFAWIGFALGVPTGIGGGAISGWIVKWAEQRPAANRPHG